MADPNRQYWNQQFKILQDTWPKSDDFKQCIDICLMLHAMVHSAAISGTRFYSFEDEVWQNRNLTEEALRKYHTDDQSIAWKLWHIARIEDMTMNTLLAGERQVFDIGDWSDRLNVNVRDTGNAMNEEEIKALSSRINMDELKQYRNDVGRKTSDIISSLTPQDLKKKMEPERIGKLLAEGDVVPMAAGIAEYWSKKTFAGLLLMPATRHQLVHLNESARLLHLTK